MKLENAEEVRKLLTRRAEILEGLVILDNREKGWYYTIRLGDDVRGMTDSDVQKAGLSRCLIKLSGSEMYSMLCVEQGAIEHKLKEL